VADFVTLPKLPEIVAVEVDRTLSVRIWKVAFVFPDCIVTVEGTVATLLLLLERLTTAPPFGAALLRVTVPLTLLLAVTLAGLSETEDTNTDETGVMVTLPCTVLLPMLAVTITGVLLRTPGWAKKENVALVEPAAIVTVDGTTPNELSVISPSTNRFGIQPVSPQYPDDSLCHRSSTNRTGTPEGHRHRLRAYGSPYSEWQGP
jgi:hypothetical protein